MMVHRETSRLITQRTTKAKAKHKEDQGLISLRKILKDIIEKRNKANKEKASTRSDASARDRIVANNKSFTVTKPSFARRD